MEEWPFDKQFNQWWDDNDFAQVNPFNNDTPAYWAWEGWIAGRKVEREACAKVAESYEPRCDTCPSGVSNAIRARSNHD